MSVDTELLDTRAVDAHTAKLTTDQVWHAIEKRSFAIVGYETPEGDPRSSGVMYEVAARRLYVAVDPNGWKARHIAASGRVSVTVPVHRAGVLALVAPIPPATVSFHGEAYVHPAGSIATLRLLERLGSLLPRERRATAAVIEIVPDGAFVTYGVGVPLREMRDTERARARVAVA
jgi:pyridoxamine 5'-phosphate oxidase-like protein